MKLKRKQCLYFLAILIGIFIIALLSYQYNNSYSITNEKIEHFTNDTIIKHNNGIFDSFYSRIYDKIFTDIKKSSFEITNIIATTLKNVDDPFPKKDIKFLDAGCGTGISASVIGKLYPITCLDKSNAMLEIAKTRQSDGMKLLQGDIKDRSIFQKHSFSHILCLYFTIYFFQNIDHIFENFSKWIKPKGFLVIHLVDKKAFDPVANPSSPFILTDPQSYSKKRITKSTIAFNNFKYTANFKLVNDNKAIFDETFDFNDDRKNRHQQHILYMYNKAKYVEIAEKYGFVLHTIEPQTLSGYAHHYLFIFRKIKNEKLISSISSIPPTKSISR